MAHRAGGRTCRGRRPGPPSWSAGIRAPPRAPPPRSGARARSGDSPARWQAQRAVLGSSLKPSRAGRQLGCSLPPSPPAGLYKLGPPPALRGVPASALPRRLGVPGTPAAPRTSAPRQSSGLGLASRHPRPQPGARRRPPPPTALVLQLSVRVGTCRGRFSLADPAGTLKKGSLGPGCPGKHPTRNCAPRGRSDFRFAATDVRTQRPLGTVSWPGAAAQRTSTGPGWGWVGGRTVGCLGAASSPICHHHQLCTNHFSIRQ